MSSRPAPFSPPPHSLVFVRVLLCQTRGVVTDTKEDTDLPSEALLLVQAGPQARAHSTVWEEGYMLEARGHGGRDRAGGRPLGVFTEEAPEVGLEG